MKRVNILLALGGSIFLSACHMNEERSLLLNPDQLKQTVMACQAGQQADDKLCQKAQLVAQVVSAYEKLEQQYGGDWLSMRAQYYSLQSKISNEQNPIIRQNLLNQQNAVLASAGQAQFLVQQEFAKLIMQAESQLSALKAQLKTASAAAEPTIEQQIKTTKEQIKIMLTMVSINVPSP